MRPHFLPACADRLAHLHRRCACYCCLARARGLFPLLRRRAAHSARIAPTIFLPTRVTRAASRRRNGSGSCVFSLLRVRSELSVFSSSFSSFASADISYSTLLLTHLGTAPMPIAYWRRLPAINHIAFAAARLGSVKHSTLRCHAVCCSLLQCTRTIPTTHDRRIFVACCNISRTLATTTRFLLSYHIYAQNALSRLLLPPNWKAPQPRPMTNHHRFETLVISSGRRVRYFNCDFDWWVVAPCRFMVSWPAGSLTLLLSIVDHMNRPVTNFLSLASLLPVSASTDP